jgi:predicted SnoaL-like aldol condensation-catalyzing enzyme
MNARIDPKREILRQWFESFNTGNLEEMKAVAVRLSTPEYKLHDPGYSKPEVDLSEFFEGFESFLRTILDPKVEIQDMLVEGDKTATRVVYKWTDVETRQPKEGMGIFFHRFENDKIAEEWQVMVITTETKLD